MKVDNYFSERDLKNLEKINKLKCVLPDFCSDFLLGIENVTTPLTRLGYAHDCLTFFQFLTSPYSKFNGVKIKELTYSDLNLVTDTDIENFLSYLSGYKSNNKTYINGTKTKARKFACIRTMFKYFYKKNKINSNVCEKVNAPKLKDKEIVRLEVEEMANLLDSVETGELLTEKQRSYHKHTAKRDTAILTLFLGTGIRISELVGLDIDDIDLKQNAFTITRKGGNRVILYYPDEVASVLMEYLSERQNNKKINENEKALFVSLQNKRMSIRSVENLVIKYSNNVTPLKHITPHKLRSTYGTNLYKETGDIYVVADVLGHKDVNTTKKYYAAITDDIRRNAASKVKLREN